MSRDEAAWEFAILATQRPRRPVPKEEKTALDAILADDLEAPWQPPSKEPDYIPVLSAPGGLRLWVEQSVRVVPKTLPRLVRERPTGVTEPELRRTLQEGLEKGWWVLDRDMKIGAPPIGLNF